MLGPQGLSEIYGGIMRHHIKKLYAYPFCGTMTNLEHSESVLYIEDS